MHPTEADRSCHSFHLASLRSSFSSAIQRCVPATICTPKSDQRVLPFIRNHVPMIAATHTPTSHPSDHPHPNVASQLSPLSPLQSLSNDYFYLHPNIASQRSSPPTAQHRVPAMISDASQCRVPATTCTPNNGQRAVSSTYRVSVIVAICIPKYRDICQQLPTPNYSHPFHFASQ